MPLNDDIADALTRHQIGLQRLSTATVRKIVALLNRADTRIVERLLRDDLTELGRQRQERLLRDIRRIVESVYRDATGQLQIDLEALAEYEVDYQLDMFRRLVPVEVEFVRPASDQIVAAVNSRPFQGRYLKDWYTELEAGAFRRLRNTIRLGIVEGRTTSQIVRDIRGTRANGFKDGILQTSRRAAEATVRTAVNHTANASRARLYERNKRLIRNVQWVSVLDGRTTLICMSRDGNVYPVDSGPRPPAHPNCRSTTVPTLKGWREVGIPADAPVSTRASMNGQVAEDLTYSDWLRKQPAEFQDEVLGRSKGRLFRSGGLDVDRFVDANGRGYTLDELRQREAAAWERAGLAA